MDNPLELYNFSFSFGNRTLNTDFEDCFISPIPKTLLRTLSPTPKIRLYGFH